LVVIIIFLFFILEPKRANMRTAYKISPTKL